MAFMYCPNCKGVVEVKATGTSKQTQKEKRVHFRRNRTCQNCNAEFKTIEVHEDQMIELEELKNLVKEIYNLTRQYQPRSLYQKLKAIKNKT